jgi:hypothetical protein
MIGAILGAAGLLSPFFTGGAKGAAGERGNQNNFISQNNQALASLYGINQNALLQALQGEEAGKLNRGQLDLAQRNFALNAPSVRGRQGLSADMLANFKPATMQGLPSRISSRMPTIQGPQLSGQGQLLAKLIRDNAISGMQKGDTFDPIPTTDFKSGVLPKPQLQSYVKPGKLESILSAIGLITGAAGALQPKDTGTTPPYIPQGAG